MRVEDPGTSQTWEARHRGARVTLSSSCTRAQATQVTARFTDPAVPGSHLSAWGQSRLSRSFCVESTCVKAL